MREMTAMDRALRTFPARSPETRPHIGMVLHCAGAPPSLSQVVEHVAERLSALPVLTARLDPRETRWNTSARIDLGEHVTERVLAQGSDLAREVRGLAAAPLPDDAPLWRLHLLHGHAADEYALFYRVHHALQDASGCVHTLERLFTSDDAVGVSSAPYRGFAENASPFGHWIRAGTSLARMVLRSGGWSPFKARFSDERVLHWCEVPTARLKEAAGRYGGTVNDAYLAALAHALTRWFADRGRPVRRGRLPLLVPVNLRRPGEADAPGNRTVLVPVDLPGGDLTAAERLAGTPGSTASLKSPGRRAALRRYAELVPGSLVRRILLVLTSPGHTTALASNVALRRPLDFRGDQVKRITPVMWAPQGVPLTALLLTYQGTTTICFTADPRLPGLEGIHEHWLDAVQSWA